MGTGSEIFVHILDSSGVCGKLVLNGYTVFSVKGQSHKIYYIHFFAKQLAPPGPIRDVMGPIQILTFFVHVKNFQDVETCRFTNDL